MPAFPIKGYVRINTRSVESEAEKRTRSKREDSGPHSNHRSNFPRTRHDLIQPVQKPQHWGVVALDLVVCATLWAFEGFLDSCLIFLRTLDPMKQTGF